MKVRIVGMGISTSAANDFRNKARIINGYKTANAKYLEYKEYVESDPLTAEEALNLAGVKLYEAFEWSMKHYLYNRYDELSREGEMMPQEATKRRNGLFVQSFTVSGKRENVNTTYLYDEMKKYAVPSVDLPSFDTVLNNRQPVNNGQKHNAISVDITKFEESLLEVKKIILKYVDENAPLQTSQPADYYKLQENFGYWQRNPNYDLGLIIEDTSTLNENEKRLIVSIPWSIVFDFDVSSMETGLEKMYVDVWGVQPNFFNPIDSSKTEYDSAAKFAYWFMINGRKDIPATLVNDIRDWSRKYKSKFSSTIEEYHKVFPKPLKLLIVNGNSKKIQGIIESIDSFYLNDYQACLLPEETQYEELLSIYGACIEKYHLDIKDLAAGLSNFSSYLGQEKKRGEYTVVGKDGEISVPIKNYSHFEVVYLGIEKDEEKSEMTDFYCGKTEISWGGIAKEYAIERRKQFIYICDEITKRCANKPYSMFELRHDPGAGGTTLGRQVALHMSKTHPVVMLKHYKEITTASQLSNFFDIVRTSIVIIAENSIVDDSNIYKLKAELKSNSVPYVLLYIKRIEDSKYHNDYDLTILNDTEFEDMKIKLEPYLDDNSRNIINKMIISNRDRYPLLMALVAFEEEYTGLSDYVTRFMTKCKTNDLVKLGEISLVDLYANTLLPLSFYPRLNCDRGYGIFMDSINDNLITIENEKIKMRHPLIAKEVLEYIICKGAGPLTGPQRADRLVDLVTKFIVNSRTNEMLVYESTTDVLKELLISRSTDRIDRDDFAPIIVEIERCFDRGSDVVKCAAIGKIFTTLEHEYPDEPHFKAHLSRFYTNIEKNYEKGIEKAKEAIDTAIQFYQNDALLYHIYGMSERRYIEEKLYKEVLKDNFLDDDRTIEIQQHLSEASKAFLKSRQLNHKSAGYISDIIMCIKVIDFGKSLYKCSTAELIEKHSDSWIMEYCDRAMSLYESYNAILASEDDEAEDKFDRNQLSEKINDIFEVEDSIQKTLKMWEDYLRIADYKHEMVARRFIARAKWRQFEKTKNQADLRDVIINMEHNMDLEPTNPDNVRLWLNALRYYETDQPENEVDNALVKLAALKSVGDNLEAYYYFFVLSCIKAIEHDSLAESKIPDLLKELREKTKNVPTKNVIHEWIGKGTGISRLFKPSKNNSTDVKVKGNFEHIQEQGEQLEGVLTAYNSERSAVISSSGMEVFFTPAPTGQAIASVTKEDVGKRVSFIAGFSYDGVRALNKSVHIIEKSANSEDKKENIGSTKPKIGDKVKVKVDKIDIKRECLRVKLPRYKNVQGIIEKTEIPNDKKMKDYESEGSFYATVIREGYRPGLYELSVKPDDERYTEWQKSLQEIKKSVKDY